MSEEYQDLVLATYKKKKANGELSLLLANATAAKLKKACLKNYEKRHAPEDDDIFSEFFNVDKLNTDFWQTIKKADPGEFRPLLKHINGETGSTDYKNSELLAWLIDFQPRPSIAYYRNLQIALKGETGQVPKDDDPPSDTNSHSEKRDKNESDPPSTELSNTEHDINDDSNIPPPENPEKKYKRKLIITISISIALGAPIWFISKSVTNSSYREPLSNENCMYWTGNHYEPVACDTNINGIIKLPLNKEQLIHQKQITQPDTLTQNSLGKVWYAKVDGKLQFYADSGTHPTDTLKRLRPLTKYILTKYVSYYRYLYKLLAWSISVVIFIALCLAGITTFIKKHKRSTSQSGPPMIISETLLSN